MFPEQCFPMSYAIILLQNMRFTIKKKHLVSDGAICHLFFVHSSHVRGARG